GRGSAPAVAAGRSCAARSACGYSFLRSSAWRSPTTDGGPARSRVPLTKTRAERRAVASRPGAPAPESRGANHSVLNASLGEAKRLTRTSRRRADMATTIPTKVSTPTDLRDWLRRVDALGELQTVRGANTEEDIGMATELLGRTRPSKATVFDEIKGYKKGFRVLSNG